MDLYNGPFSRVMLIFPHGSTGLSFALNPIPLGLECLAGFIREEVAEMMLFDESLDKEPFSRVIVAFKPDLVAVSMSATEHDTGKALVAKVKRYDPRIPVIAGGFHPTGAHAAVFDDLAVDAIARGEGELTFMDVVKGKPWRDIAGLSFRTPGGIVHNPDREQIQDLDALPFPARDMRKKRGYVYKNALMPDREYDLMYFGRGCWGKCTFCCEPYFSNGRQRYRSPDRAFEEIMSIYDLHGRKPLRILISDPNILGQHKPTERLAELLIAAGNGWGHDVDITFQVMSRAEHIVMHPDVVEKMIRAGMISWELGLESSSEEDLKITNKQIPLEKQEKAVSILRSLGGEVLGTYVIGLESQSKAFIKTLPDRGRMVGCASCAFGIATPFPGSGFWDEMDAKGRIFEKNWARFDENNAVITHPEMTPKELEDLRSWCMGRFWNLDVVVDQIRIQEIRVGPFRRKYKAGLKDFLQSVGGKLLFAASAGGELAGKHGGKADSQKDHYMKSLRAIFSAFVNPRVEKYFQAHPMHESVDMRQFGRLFSGKTFQIVLENPARKTSEFVLVVTITRQGIDKISIGRKPVPGYNLLLRANSEVLYVPPNLTQIQILRNSLAHVKAGNLRLEGWGLVVKLILYGIKEALAMKLTNGKSGTN
ncbi:MAG: cobalamin-dependent protein [Candidatus Lokiarchaeota archaeon]|nr:cobalamin-dependent protein [Candidatus Lokiarchaeota archaeon]